MISRRRPLHACGVSLIAVAHIAFTKSENLEWVGPKVKKVAAFWRPVRPLIKASEYMWLAVLFLMDSYILAVEKLTEFLFPPSTHLFNQIDELVQSVEAFPRELDNAINRFPVIIHQYLHLDYAVAKVISWLKNCLSSLTSELDDTREKDIMIDLSCHLTNTESALIDEGQGSAVCPNHGKSENKEKFPLTSDTPQAETVADGSTCEPDATRPSYKDVLKKRTEENIGSKGDATAEEADSEKEKIENSEGKVSVTREEEALKKVTEENIEGKGDYDKKEAAEEKQKDEVKKTNQVQVGGEDFLQLFESVWQVSPSKKTR